MTTNSTITLRNTNDINIRDSAREHSPTPTFFLVYTQSKTISSEINLYITGLSHTCDCALCSCKLWGPILYSPRKVKNHNFFKYSHIKSCMFIFCRRFNSVAFSFPLPTQFVAFVSVHTLTGGLKDFNLSPERPISRSVKFLDFCGFTPKS